LALSRSNALLPGFVRPAATTDLLSLRASLREASTLPYHWQCRE
jgi:hypothetical protein